MAAYRLTGEADADISRIYEYSLTAFGEVRAGRYLFGLIGAFETIAGNHFIGADRSYIKPGYRRFVHESHVIYYRIRAEDILIMRVLGASQDPECNL